jgi:uncharacterized membrane protein HdeD (DUF308 family)
MTSMNISPESGKFWFTVAIGIVMLSVGLLFVTQPGTSAFYINLVSLGIGLALLILIVVLVRKSNQ